MKKVTTPFQKLKLLLATLQQMALFKKITKYAIINNIWAYFVKLTYYSDFLKSYLKTIIPIYLIGLRT